MREKVLGLLLSIPKGKVTTYRELARAAGTGPRAVGSVMRSNDRPDKYPCYKVISSSGHVGGYTSPKGLAEKIRRLEADGVEVRSGRVDLERFLFRF